MSMWKLETNVNLVSYHHDGVLHFTVTTVLASLKIAYLAINSLHGQRYPHIITRMK